MAASKGRSRATCSASPSGWRRPRSSTSWACPILEGRAWMLRDAQRPSPATRLQRGKVELDCVGLLARVGARLGRRPWPSSRSCAPRRRSGPSPACTENTADRDLAALLFPLKGGRARTGATAQSDRPRPSASAPSSFGWAYVRLDGDTVSRIAEHLAEHLLRPSSPRSRPRATSGRGSRTEGFSPCACR